MKRIIYFYDKKHFGNSISIYDNDTFFFVVIKDRSDYYFSVLSNDRKKYYNVDSFVRKSGFQYENKDEINLQLNIDFFHIKELECPEYIDNLFETGSPFLHEKKQNFFSKIKKTMDIEKANMPSYQYNFLYKRVMPGLLYFIGGAIIVIILCVVLSVVSDSDFVPLIPVMIWAIGAVPLLVLFVVHSKRLSTRLILDKTKEFDEKYQIISYEIAQKKLDEGHFIQGDRLIYDGNDIALRDCIVYFYAKTLSGIYSFSFVFYKKSHPIDNALLIQDLDNFNYTYFNQNIDYIFNKYGFQLFLYDKKEFLRLLLKFNDPNKIESFLAKNNIH